MKDLTDLEICKRIAEIDFILYSKFEFYVAIENEKVTIKNRRKCDIYENYDPLTDDALIFNLAFNNKVKIDYFDECVYIGLKHKLARCKFNNCDIESLRKAICLVIIQAHE